MPLDPPNNYVGDWDALDENNNPPGGDSRREGDNQIRGVKGSCARSFPQIVGPMNASDAELNTMVGISTGSSVESRLTSLESDVSDLQGAVFPVGTKLIFFMAAGSLPTGWVAEAANHDRMLRVVDGSTLPGGGVGGSASPILMDIVVPHSHTYARADVAGTFTVDGGGALAVISALGTTPAVTDGAGTGNWEPKYMDVVVGVKT